MRKIILFLFVLCLVGAVNAQDRTDDKIALILNEWHKAAADAKFDAYFNAMAEDSYFLGTDANEYWDKRSFMRYAKPYFDKGKTWSFTPMERHIYLSKDGKMAWFDELLNTQMKICRGSGVLMNINGQWKIVHYVLSMTIPNENADAVIKIKAPVEDAFIKTFDKK